MARSRSRRPQCDVSRLRRSGSARPFIRTRTHEHFPFSLYLAQKKWAFRVAYFVGNAIIISILYSIESSQLYVQPERGTISQNGGIYTRNVHLERFFWVTLICAWFSYMFIQGSSPGYILPGRGGSFVRVLPTP